jgi:hypothetical protein
MIYYSSKNGNIAALRQYRDVCEVFQAKHDMAHSRIFTMKFAMRIISREGPEVLSNG